MPSRARDRQLAKQHARRQAAKQAQGKRRKVIAGAVGAVVGIVAIAIGASILFGGDPEAAAPSLSSGPSSTTTVEPTPTGKGLPNQVGEVEPEVAPPATVACGGDVPPGAGEPKPQYDAAPKVDKVIDEDASYVATVETSCGTIEIDLFADVAPQTVASFAFLADQGFFDGLTFHRLVPGFVIQGGDPLGSGTGGPGYLFGDETDPKVVFDRPGLLAMANSGPGTTGSQFFITLGGEQETGHLNGLHTIFGEVTAGMDVVDAIAAIAADASGIPTEAVYIDSVTVEEQPA
jgi:cyclophilin family peptidyl-prolyl cis-trans isomerase